MEICTFSAAVGRFLTHRRQVTLVRAALWELTKKLESLEQCVQSDRNRLV
jgi:hypothetical protein